MLRFASAPDPVFIALLHDALEATKEWLALELTEGDSGWEAQYPKIAACFSPRMALDTINRLLEADASAVVHRLTDYHYLLIHQSLEVSCAVHNDYRAEHPDGLLPIGPFLVGEIDFGALRDLYFEDEDFLFDREWVDRMGPEGWRQMGLTEQAVRIARGLRPRARDLEFRPVDPPDPVDDEDRRRRCLAAYPPLGPENGEDQEGPSSSPSAPAA